MTHLTDLQFSLYADKALGDRELNFVSQHLESCVQCQASRDDWIAEKQHIVIALNTDDAATASIPPAPKFTKRLSMRDFAIANVLTGLVIWLAQFLWKTLFGELIVNTFSRFAFPIPDVYGLLVSAALYLSQEGATMIENYLGFVVLCLVAMSLIWLVHLFRKPRSTLAFCFVVAVSGGLFTPSPALALEHRHDENSVTVAASETIDDTLVIAADTVIVEGTVTGDLIAVGERVIVNGSIGGNLIAFAETVTLHGEVNGSVITAGSSVELSDIVIKGDLWAAAGDISFDRESSVRRNMTAATEMVSVAGEVRGDLTVFGETAELSGTVGKDFEAFSGRVNLLGNATVAGNLRFRTNDEDKLQKSSTATVGGEIEFLPSSSKSEPENRYFTGDFYLGQIARLVSAFIFGVALLWLFPALRDESLEDGIDGLKTAGIGLVTLVSLPVIVLIFAITLIGLPLSIFGFFSWLLLVYTAKIVLASVIGQQLLGATSSHDSLLLTILSGLVVVIVAVNLPFIGGIINFILTIIGIGLIVRFLLDYTAGLNGQRGSS